jgi:NNP family nitrate/nitrite transporter-like MFS transporter
MSKIEHWDVEDEQFWATTGKKIASRNLWISIPNLLCGFSIWLYWGMLAKFIQKIHFANPELFDFTFMNDGQPYQEKAWPGRPCASPTRS